MSAREQLSTEAAARVEALERRVAYELACLGYPTRDWVPPTRRPDGHVHDVVIVGGGQSGVAIAFGLTRERVTNILVVDRKPAGQEGPWRDIARMRTLRTPKAVTGPDLGVPSLSARAWYEARFGAEAWRDLGKIPREHWHDYLAFVRRATGIAVANGVEVCDLAPRPDGLINVHVRRNGPPAATERVIARKVVLATGIEGSGCWHVPAMVSEHLPRERYAHTADAIDFASLAGKQVAVLGAGASAFDNAALALEHGAARVDMLVRRRQIPVVNPYRWMEQAGFLRHFGDLDDATKWRFMRLIFGMNQPPPQDAFDRCARFGNFAMALGRPPESVAFADGQVRIRTGSGVADYDFLIVGTGLAVDLAGRPELRRIAPDIALWRDRHVPEADEADDVLGGYPYLGRSFELLEKHPGRAPWLAHIHSYTFGAMPSLACSAGISNLKFGVERVVRGITRGLFVADAELHLKSLQAYAEMELDTRRARSPESVKTPAAGGGR
jgi:cation diffusion facilitator CzcD-associated flavoprotein CzcO